MSCIKPEDIEKVLPEGVTLDTNALEQAITAAGCMMDDVAACMGSVSSSCLAQIQIYLAAHFYATTDYTLSLQSETDDCAEASVRYGFKFGEGIKGTPFGQMANTLSRGCLAEFDKQPVHLFSIGSH